MSPYQLISSGTIWERKIVNADKEKKSKEKELIRKNVSNVNNNDVQPTLNQLFVKKEKYESSHLYEYKIGYDARSRFCSKYYNWIFFFLDLDMDINLILVLDWIGFWIKTFSWIWTWT